MKETSTMRSSQAICLNQAGTGSARVYAGFPCATTPASWLVTSIQAMAKNHKPEPRRHLTS